MTEFWEVDRATEQAELRRFWRRGQMLVGLDQQDFTTDENGNVIDVYRIAGEMQQFSARYRDLIIRFYRAFPGEEDLDQFLSLRMRSGRGLTWPHVIELLIFWPHSSESCRREFDGWVGC